MNRLPYEVCKTYYDSLGIVFEGYNDEQFAVIKNYDRFPLVVGGERGGKSWVSAAIMVPHMDLLPDIDPENFYEKDEDGRLTDKLKYDETDRQNRPMDPNFVIFGPTYAEPRIEFSYIEDWLRQLDLVSRISKPTDGPWRLITKRGVVLQTWSTDNPGSIRGIDLDGALAVEAGNMQYDAIERIQGRIGAKTGFLIYNGTMENAQRWYINMALEGQRENRWEVVTYSIPSWSNKHQFPGGREDPEIKRWEKFYTEETFLTRVAAQPVPPRDRVLREFDSSHIKKLDLPRDADGNLDCKIEVAIDPGYLPSAYAILWVASWDTPEGKYWHVFDEFYEQEVNNLDAIRWLKKNKYWRYIGHGDITIDVSAKRHSDGNEPAIEVYSKMAGVELSYKYWHENSLIERLRTTAKHNLISIDPRCEGLIAELGLGDPVFPGMHPWKYPSSKDGTILNDKPQDKWNHSVKALGYLLLRHLGLVERLGPPPKKWNRLDPNRKRTAARRTYLRS